MSAPQTNIADERASDMRGLVKQLADVLSSRTFSPRIKLLDLHAVMAATTLSEHTIERMLKDDKFPKPQNNLGKRMWRESAIIAWMDQNDPNLPKEG